MTGTDTGAGRAGWRDLTAFWRASMRHHRTVGAVAPSGQTLVRALTAPARTVRRPVRALEVGAGTGVITRALAAGLPRGSHLDTVEINPELAARVRRWVDTATPGPTVPVRVFAVPVGDLDRHVDTSAGYDLIVSGLPLTNFTPDEVDAVMRQLLGLLRPGGTLSWFGYVGTGAARVLVSARSEVERHRAVVELIERRLLEGVHLRRTVWANVPPAHVWTLRPHAARGSTS